MVDIVQISDLDAVYQHLTKNTILLLDIDDTLVTPFEDHATFCPNKIFSQWMKNGQWRTKNGKFMSYCNKDYLKLVKKYNIAIENIEWKCTQPNLPKLLNMWKKKAIVTGFTARGMEIRKQTYNMLSCLKLSFQRNAVDETYISNITGRSGFGSKAIIFCGGYDKGFILNEILKVVNSTVACINTTTSIILVDDNIKNHHDTYDGLQMFNQHLLKNTLDGETNAFKQSLTFKGLHYVRK